MRLLCEMGPAIRPADVDSCGRPETANPHRRRDAHDVRGQRRNEGHPRCSRSSALSERIVWFHVRQNRGWPSAYGGPKERTKMLRAVGAIVVSIAMAVPFSTAAL